MEQGFVVGLQPTGHLPWCWVGLRGSDLSKVNQPISISKIGLGLGFPIPSSVP